MSWFLTIIRTFKTGTGYANWPCFLSASFSTFGNTFCIVCITYQWCYGCCAIWSVPYMLILLVTEHVHPCCCFPNCTSFLMSVGWVFFLSFVYFCLFPNHWYVIRFEISMTISSGCRSILLRLACTKSMGKFKLPTKVISRSSDAWFANQFLQCQDTPGVGACVSHWSGPCPWS